MKKKLLITILVILFSLIIMASQTSYAGRSFPDSYYSAKIGDTKYFTISQAVKKAQDGDTIVLFTGVTGSSECVTIPEGKTITIDLYGYTITNTAGNHTIINKGNLTIIDSVGGGKVDNISNNYSAIYNAYGATCTLSGGTYDRSCEASTSSGNNGGNSYYTISNLGNMTINDGVTVETASGNSELGKFSSLIHNGGTSEGISTMTINGGSFSGGINTIKNDYNGVLTINGGTFKNTSQASLYNLNIATVNGGTFEQSGGTDANIYALAYKPSGSGCTGKLTITGGTFKAKYTLIQNTSEDWALDKNSVNISGGVFECTENLCYSDFEDRLVITGGRFTFGNDKVDAKYLDSDFVLYQNSENVAYVGAKCSYDSNSEIATDENGDKIITVPVSESAVNINESVNLTGERVETTWESSDEDIATIETSGSEQDVKINFIKAGDVTITKQLIYYSENEKYNDEDRNTKETIVKQYKYTVKNPITAITLDKTEETINKYETLTLNATIEPTDTTDDKTLTWTSDDENIATVDENGVVTAKNEGTVIIKATTNNGLTASCKITVVEDISNEETTSNTTENTDSEEQDATIETGNVSDEGATSNITETTDSEEQDATIKTSDNIIFYVGMLVVAIAGLVGIKFLKEKLC